MLRVAIQLSNASPNNITAAHKSCQIWSELLNEQDSLGFQGSHPPDVVALSLALYGSCLVRVGKDAEAVTVYDKALSLDSSRQDLHLSKAQALQRLLRYEDAGHIFQALNSDVGLIGAATCALRMGDLRSAQSALARVEPSMKQASPALQGLVGTIRYLESGSFDASIINLLRSAARVDLLYRWIYSVLTRYREDMTTISEFKLPGDPLLSLLKLNLCPFDDPSLRLLDDKVQLHRILSKHADRTKSFWPPGMVLSTATTAAEVHETLYGRGADSLYFLKERSGYGSHGNRILSGSEVNVISQEVMGSMDDSERLLQAMVNPPMLVHGRKFSLRIYVIFFSTAEVYLSSSGLLKLAALEYASDDSVDPKVHVTNSGSGMGMEQYDLDYFRAYLQKMERSYDVFWGA